MSKISDNNLVSIPLSSLKAGQRLEKRTAADGSVIYIAQGIGSVVSDGKVYVEAQTTFTDDTSTNVTIDRLAANRQYVYTQPLTRLIITAVDDNTLESEIRFTAGQNFRITLPNSVGIINQVTFTPGISYVVVIKNNLVVMSDYTTGDPEQ